MEDVAIKIDNLSKEFKLPHEKHTSIKSAFINFYKRDKGYEMQEALKNVSFQIKKGEFFGIVGRNGSGKSTLLKLLAGIYTPTSGNIAVNGTLTPFIELGVGFSPELTGRENVFLNGSLLGFNRAEMEGMYKDIVAFAELERFMDQKLKNYSSGMQVRLAFSIAIRVQSDILVLDEVLAVGDESFQQKCYSYFKEIKSTGKTMVLVSHDMDAVEKYCNRAILINDGILRDEGHPKDIAAKYRLLNLPKAKIAKNTGSVKLHEDVVIDKVTINDSVEALVGENDDLSVETLFTPKKSGTYIASISIARTGDQHLAYYDSREKSQKIKCKKNQQYKAVCNFSAKQFLRGAYKIEVDFRDKNDVYLARQPEAVQFSVTESDVAKAGTFGLDGHWQITKSKKN